MTEKTVDDLYAERRALLAIRTSPEYSNHLLDAIINHAHSAEVSELRGYILGLTLQYRLARNSDAS